MHDQPGRQPVRGDLVTSRMLGVFRDNPGTRQEFLSAIDPHGASRSGNLSA